MATVAIDFETTYDSLNSLSKLSVAEYLQNTQIICASISIDGQPAKSYTDMQELKQVLLPIANDSNSVLVAHNANFDAAVLYDKLGIIFKNNFCTVSAARVFDTCKTGSASLSVLAEHYDLPHKIQGVLADAKGLSVDRILSDDHLRESLLTYCERDTDICYKLYEIYAPRLSDQDKREMSFSILRSIIPLLRFDGEQAQRLLDHDEQLRKQLIASAGIPQTSLRSTKQFAQALQDLGVEPPKRVSKTTGKLSYCFSKDFPEFTCLQSHQNPAVAALVRARLGTASSILESRLQRLFGASRATGRLPVPLNWFGTQSGRFSSAQKLGMLTLPRPASDGSDLGGIRSTILPILPHHEILALDLKQGELRIASWLAGSQTVAEAINKGLDPYTEFASRFHNKAYEAITKDERHLAKICCLSLQYQSGAARLASVLDTDEETAQTYVTRFRMLNEPITNMWQQLHGQLLKCARTRSDFTLPLPTNTRTIRFHDVQADHDGITYKDSRGVRRHVYGGSAFNQLVQSTAGLLIRDIEQHASSFLVAHGLPPWALLQVHDEVVYSMPPELIPAFLEHMTSPEACPTWANGLPFELEFSHGSRYSACK